MKVTLILADKSALQISRGITLRVHFPAIPRRFISSE